MHSGVIEQFGLWNPEDLGFLAAYAAKALMDGDITGAEGDKFEAGKLGSYTVEKDGEVVLGRSRCSTSRTWTSSPSDDRPACGPAPCPRPGPAGAHLRPSPAGPPAFRCGG